LVILEFGRIQTKKGSESITGAQLESHIEAIRAKGFTPVTLKQVADAYQHGASLPSRAVLLTFDGGYLSTYEEAHPILAKQKCPALMFLETGHQAIRDPVFLFWDRIQLMVDSGIWEIGTHGHRPLTPTGMPLPGANSGEESFAQSKVLIESHVRHCQVRSFARLAHVTPPLVGTSGSEIRPELAFQSDEFGTNGPEDAPLRLNRLQVEPTWSPEVLAQRLEWSITTPDMNQPETSMARWIPASRSDAIRREGSTLIFSGFKRADTWLSGSRWAQDFSLQAKIKLGSGEFWFAQEVEYGGRHWRLGGRAETLYFQDRTPGTPPNTLMRFPLPTRLEGWHTFSLTRRGPGLWVTLDGKPLNEFPLLLPGRWTGNLGILTAPGESGKTLFEITEYRFTPIPYRIQSMKSDPSRAEIQNLEGTASDLSAISPTWILRKNGKSRESALNEDLLHMLQRRFVLDVLPSVKAMDSADADTEWLKSLAKRAASTGWNGLRLDVSDLPPSEQNKWLLMTHEMEMYMGTLNLRWEVFTNLSAGDAR